MLRRKGQDLRSQAFPSENFVRPEAVEDLEDGAAGGHARVTTATGLYHITTDPADPSV